MDAEASKKLDRSLDRDGGIMVYVGEGERGARRARRGWKIEIKGRWVIAVAWEAGQDKSNRTGNRNATPSSDHERKNPHGKSPGINSVPRLEPDWSNSLGATCASFFFYPLSVLFSPYAYTLSFFFFLFLDDPRRTFQSSCNPRRILNFDRQLRWSLELSLSLSFRAGRVDLLAAISIETSRDLRSGRSRLWRRDEEIGWSI